MNVDINTKKTPQFISWPLLFGLAIILGFMIYNLFTI